MATSTSGATERLAPPLFGNLVGAAIVVVAGLLARNDLLWLLLIAITVVVRFWVLHRWRQHPESTPLLLSRVVFLVAIAAAHGIAFGRGFMTALAVIAPAILLVVIFKDAMRRDFGALTGSFEPDLGLTIGYFAISFAGAMSAQVPVAEWIEFPAILVHSFALIVIVYRVGVHLERAIHLREQMQRSGG